MIAGLNGLLDSILRMIIICYKKRDIEFSPAYESLRMNCKFKLWTQLGLGTALAGGMLTACDGAMDGGTADNGAASQVAASEQSGAVAGEGEGGVAVNRADTDPVAYGIALAVTEAHVVAARDAYAVGQKDAAAEMFAHPAAEVLVEMDPVFAKLGVDDFKLLLTDASAAAADGKSIVEVDKTYDAIIAALRGAATKAPDNGAADAKVAAGVIADQIERANAMYRTTAKDDRYEPYLDGYGFAKVAQSAFAMSGTAIKADNPAAHARITEALALLKQAYPAATRPAKLTVEQGALSAASSKVLLAAGS